jgi:hypothetical protein
MFRLNQNELENWISQIVISNPGAKMGLRKPPYVFTEQGVAMLSSVLNSKRAVSVNIMIMRAFVKLREIMATHVDLARKIGELEERYSKHDRHIQMIFKIIKQLIEPFEPRPESEKPPIGFRPGR